MGKSYNELLSIITESKNINRWNKDIGHEYDMERYRKREKRIKELEDRGNVEHFNSSPSVKYRLEKHKKLLFKIKELNNRNPDPSDSISKYIKSHYNEIEKLVKKTEQIQDEQNEYDTLNYRQFDSLKYMDRNGIEHPKELKPEKKKTNAKEEIFGWVYILSMFTIMIINPIGFILLLLTLSCIDEILSTIDKRKDKKILLEIKSECEKSKKYLSIIAKKKNVPKSIQKKSLKLINRIDKLYEE